MPSCAPIGNRRKTALLTTARRLPTMSPTCPTVQLRISGRSGGTWHSVSHPQHYLGSAGSFVQNFESSNQGTACGRGSGCGRRRYCRDGNGCPDLSTGDAGQRKILVAEQIQILTFAGKYDCGSCFEQSALTVPEIQSRRTNDSDGRRCDTRIENVQTGHFSKHDTDHAGSASFRSGHYRSRLSE